MRARGTRPKALFFRPGRREVDGYSTPSHLLYLLQHKYNFMYFCLTFQNTALTYRPRVGFADIFRVNWVGFPTWLSLPQKAADSAAFFIPNRRGAKPNDASFISGRFRFAVRPARFMFRPCGRQCDGVTNARYRLSTPGVILLANRRGLKAHVSRQYAPANPAPPPPPCRTRGRNRRYSTGPALRAPLAGRKPKTCVTCRGERAGRAR